MTHTLIYHTGALGDFITILPAIRLYKKRNPGALVHLLGRPAHGELALSAGLVDTYSDIDNAACAMLFSEQPRLPPGLPPLREAIVFAPDNSPVITALSILAPLPVIHHAPFPGDTRPVVEYHLELIAPGPHDTGDIAPLIRFDRISSSFAAPMPDNSTAAVIHPGSGSAKKNWPTERFSTVANYLHERGHRVIWLTGPADRALREFAPVCATILDSPPLTGLAALLAGARVFIGNDSGVTHLAAATGCPTVALFGPSNPAIWSPRGPRVRTLCAPDAGSAHARMDTFSVDDVCRAGDELLRQPYLIAP